MHGLEMKNKPSFHDWDEAVYILAKQLRLAARILERRGLVERAHQLKDQARILDGIFIEADKSFKSLGAKDRSAEMIEAIENKAVMRLMKIIPPIIENMPLLARQVAVATGSSINEGIFKGPATEFFLGPVGRPEEGIHNGIGKH